MMMKDTALLETRDLVIGYTSARSQPHLVVKGIDVALRRGEFVCLLGPNGAGKSTLIRTLTGGQRPLAGTILLDGTRLENLSARMLARRMSLVLTQRVAVGMMQVVTLVALGRHPYTDWTGRLKREDEEAVWRAIVATGIEPLAYRPVCELSDGERQKALIARALAQEPELLILDEATAFLDLPRRVELMHLLEKLAHAGDRAILLSTHDLDLALRCSDRLWLLPPGGPLLSGIPEDLVLSDAFGKTFAGSGVRFDKGTGAFTLSGRLRGAVALRGKGIPGVWTHRALKRAGYRVRMHGGKADVCIEVAHDRGGLFWKIAGNGMRYVNLEDLLAALRQCRLPSGGSESERE